MVLKKKCHVFGCPTNKQKDKENITYHMAPNFQRHPELIPRWKQVIEIQEDVKIHNICSIHFQKSDYTKTGKRLNQKAFPSLFLKTENEVQMQNQTSEKSSSEERIEHNYDLVTHEDIDNSSCLLKQDSEMGEQDLVQKEVCISEFDQWTPQMRTIRNLPLTRAMQRIVPSNRYQAAIKKSAQERSIWLADIQEALRNRSLSPQVRKCLENEQDNIMIHFKNHMRVQVFKKYNIFFEDEIFNKPEFWHVWTYDIQELLRDLKKAQSEYEIKLAELTFMHNLSVKDISEQEEAEILKHFENDSEERTLQHKNQLQKNDSEDCPQSEDEVIFLEERSTKQKSKSFCEDKEQKPVCIVALGYQPNIIQANSETASTFENKEIDIEEFSQPFEGGSPKEKKQPLCKENDQKQESIEETVELGNSLNQTNIIQVNSAEHAPSLKPAQVTILDNPKTMSFVPVSKKKIQARKKIQTRAQVKVHPSNTKIKLKELTIKLWRLKHDDIYGKFKSKKQTAKAAEPTAGPSPKSIDVDIIKDLKVKNKNLALRIKALEKERQKNIEVCKKEKMKERKERRRLAGLLEKTMDINACLFKSYLQKFKKNAYYTNLGAYLTEDLMKSDLQEKLGSDTKFVHLLYAGDEVPKACEPQNKIHLSENYPTVLFKMALSPSNDLYYVVIGIKIPNVLSIQERDKMRMTAVKEIIPFVPERAQTGDFHARPSTDHLECPLGCNGTNISFESKERGFCVTIFCTTSGGHAHNCKYWNSKKCKYDILKEGGNVTKFKWFTDKIADLGAEKIKLVNPFTYKKMHMTEDKSDCRYGKKSRIFAGLTISADYTSHIHSDSNDAIEGVSSIFSLQKDVNQPSLHWLSNYKLPSSEKPGVGFDLGDNSIYLSCPRYEKHGSTRIKK